MFAQVVWWATNAALGLLLYRGVRTSLIRDYPVFFIYVAYVLASSLVLLRLSQLGAQVYAFGYWVAELISVFVGVAVILELYGGCLPFILPYDGWGAC